MNRVRIQQLIDDLEEVKEVLDETQSAVDRMRLHNQDEFPHLVKLFEGVIETTLFDYCMDLTMLIKQKCALMNKEWPKTSFRTRPFNPPTPHFVYADDLRRVAFDARDSRPKRVTSVVNTILGIIYSS